ncbi:MAG: helix-turn-helix transcriptional regulator [Bacteroidales bacterium]|nr:helix-turn-helix transcriptional regulator [Bacteroidales bacterium]
MKTYTTAQIKDELIGKRGTPEREAYEAEMKEEIEACLLGDAIRAQRKQQNLTQKQLGERVGVGEAQISKIERGNAATFTVVKRIFKALGATSGTLDLGSFGRVALW